MGYRTVLTFKDLSFSLGFIKGSHSKNRETGGPNGDRTRVSGVRGQRPRPLDDGTEFRKLLLYFQPVIVTIQVFRNQELEFRIAFLYAFSQSES